MENPVDGTAAALARAVEGAFAIEREIGRGGMGVVFLARDEHLQRAVAIKTLPPHLSVDPQVRSRFLHEARTAAGLTHPNIVPIFSAAERDAVVYFTMAYVDGESLGQRLEREGPMRAATLVPIVRQLAAALGYAHECGVVHRDVKAENVMLDRHGRAMVTDFGIARVTEAKPLTATGTVLGTVQYMSPEQVMGEPLDGRSDLYALGVLIFKAISGRFPFERTTAPAVLVAHVNTPAPRLREFAPDVPAPLDDLVATLLAKSPDARLSSASDLLTALAFMSSVALNGDVPDRTLARAPVVPLTFERPVPGLGTVDASRMVDVEPPADVPDRISSDDAQRLWARAAELQANTGAQTPPTPFVPRRADTPPAALETQGYAPQIVRDAAVDAGIDAKYVERAFAEREGARPLPVPATMTEAVPLVIQRGESMLKTPNIFLGAPSKIDFSTAFDGELNGDVLEEVADEIRMVLGEMVTVSAVGRTLTVTTAVSSTRNNGMPRLMQVQLSSRGGRTTVRALEDLSNLVGGLFGGLAAGGGLGGGAMLGGITLDATGAPIMMAFAMALTAGMAFVGARTIFQRMARKRERELELLVRRAVARAQLALAAQAAPALGPGAKRNP